MHVKVYSKIEVNFCRIISGDKEKTQYMDKITSLYTRKAS